MITSGELAILGALGAQTLAAGIWVGRISERVRELVRWKTEQAEPLLEMHDRRLTELQAKEG